MASKSMNFVRRKLKNNDELKITIHDFPELWETGEYIKTIFKDKYNAIWTDEGMVCELKDKDTGDIKTVTIKYDSKANYNLFEYNYSFGYKEDTKGTTSYVKNIMAVIEKILWGGIDINPMMPKHYDLDTEKEAYKNKIAYSTNDCMTVDEYFKDIKETYFDYNINYYIGDFICFKDSKESYKLEASITGAIPDLDDSKEVCRYVAMLPIQIEYVKKEENDKEDDKENESIIN